MVVIPPSAPAAAAEPASVPSRAGAELRLWRALGVSGAVMLLGSMALAWWPEMAAPTSAAAPAVATANARMSAPLVTGGAALREQSLDPGEQLVHDSVHWRSVYVPESTQAALRRRPGQDDEKN